MGFLQKCTIFINLIVYNQGIIDRWNMHRKFYEWKTKENNKKITKHVCFSFLFF